MLQQELRKCPLLHRAEVLAQGAERTALLIPQGHQLSSEVICHTLRSLRCVDRAPLVVVAAAAAAAAAGTWREQTQELHLAFQKEGIAF